MALDPYSSCPCGSGKKFKWCCAAFYAQIEKAFDQDRLGQHDTALHTIQELTKSHADQPAVWGYYAQFLYNHGLAQQTEADRDKFVEQAEESLSEALKRNPNFGMAHFLRGLFRENEGELLGALMLFRKAADSYDPEAHDQLAQVYERIFRLELLMLNRPVAARAALERIVHFQPGDPEVREQLDGLFGPESRLPACARKKYAFRATAKPVSTDAATGRLGDARKAFETLTQQTPDDPAAWFNLGVVLAWLGEQPRAVDALNKSVELETDDHRAEEAAALAEVLRCAHGMENDADYVEHGFILPIRDPNPIMAWLREIDAGRRMIGVQSNQETGSVSAMMVEELPGILAAGSVTLARVTAKVTIAQGAIRVWHPNRESVARVADDIHTKVNLAVEQPQEMTTPVNFGDVALEALAYPTGSADLTQAEEKFRDHARHFFEDTWAKRPLKSLGGNTPLDAVGSSLMRKRVFGAIKFVEDCFNGIVPHKRVGGQVSPITVYDFNDLRHKLGLEYISAAPPDVKVPAGEPGNGSSPEVAGVPSGGLPSPGSPQAKREIAAMNAAELAGLDVAALSLDDLEQAMRSAVKLDARDLAVAFAQAGLAKPFDAARPDRYALYAVAIQGAAAEGDLAKAVQLAETGEKHDADHNDGNRGVEFGLKKAQLFVRMKDADRAVEAFDGLIAKRPDEGKFYTTAAEEMLRMKNGPKALYFAQKGIETAKRTGNRDLEGHSQELAAAAKKAM